MPIVAGVPRPPPRGVANDARVELRGIRRNLAHTKVDGVDGNHRLRRLHDGPDTPESLLVPCYDGTEVCLMSSSPRARRSAGLDTAVVAVGRNGTGAALVEGIAAARCELPRE